MGNFKKGLYLDSLSRPSTSYTWSATLPAVAAPTYLYLDSEHIRHDNPPFEVGLWTLLIYTTDSGGGTPTITPTLYFGIDQSGAYYESSGHTILDLGGNSNFTSGGTFVARLDTQSWWCFNNGFKIRLTRSAASALVIDHAEITAL